MKGCMKCNLSNSKLIADKKDQISSTREISVKIVLLTKAYNSEEDSKICMLAINYLLCFNLVQYGFFSTLLIFCFCFTCHNEIVKYR